MRRYGSALIVILVLVAIYRLPDFVSGVMANPLYIDLGFTKSDIATVSKLYGVWIGIAGAFGGGVAVARLGLMPSLILGGLVASSSHLTLALLAAHGASLPLLTLSVSAESFASGFAGAALIAYMSSLVSPAFAATQYALLSSLYALPGKLIGGLSGVMVDEFGYVRFFRRHRGDRHTRRRSQPDSVADAEAGGSGGAGVNGPAVKDSCRFGIAGSSRQHLTLGGQNVPNRKRPVIPARSRNA